MDIVERLAQQAAETINGGEFNDGKWYTEGQRQAWRKALTPAAEKIERLRKQVEFERASLQAAFRELRKQDGDIERLREQVEFERASLRSALEELKVSDKKIEWLQKELQGQALRGTE